MFKTFQGKVSPAAGAGSLRHHLAATVARHQSTAASAITVPRIAALLNTPAEHQYPETQRLAVKGFIRSVRKQKGIAFLSIGDGSSYESLQAVLTPEQSNGLYTGAAVSITGRWIASPSKKQQTHELQADDVKVLGPHEGQLYPLQKKYHSHEFLRTIPHLRSRSAVNSLLLRLRSQTISNVGRFFESEDFVNVHPPIITSSDCEGAGEVFIVQPRGKEAKTSSEEFFRQQKYLTVSSQLHLEALAASLGKVWTLSPTFRAEKSDTPRHLSEFYMLEAEIMFTEDLETVMGVVERLLQSLAQHLMVSRIGEELLKAVESGMHDPSDDAITKLQLQERWSKLASGKWPRITYTEAMEHLQDAFRTNEELFEYRPQWDTGLQAEHEKFLAKMIGQDGPIFITDYPRNIKAFYMPNSPNQAAATPKSELTVSCFDLVVPELCEIAGGSLREYHIEPLLASMTDHGMMKSSQVDLGQDLVGKGNTNKHAPETASSITPSLQWYLDLRRYGSAQHGGFGLGFDRILCYLSGVSSVRDMVAFPRWYGRCDA